MAFVFHFFAFYRKIGIKADVGLPCLIHPPRRNGSVVGLIGVGQEMGLLETAVA